MKRTLLLGCTLLTLSLSHGCSTQSQHPESEQGNTIQTERHHSAISETGDTGQSSIQSASEEAISEDITPSAPAVLLEKHNAAIGLASPAAGMPERKAKLQQRDRTASTAAFADGSIGYYPAEPQNRENYAHVEENRLRQTREHPVSTFAIDVDTGSYSNVRRLLTAGRLPPRDAVRIEELINYFDYDYPVPNDRSQPFQVSTEIATTPWNKNTKLLHIGIKGYRIDNRELAPANLVFLVDVSGSMQSVDKLELLKTSLKLLLGKLRAQDRVSLVVYAGASGVVLEPTPGDQRLKIQRALEQLTAGGSTNGAAGIRLAYQLAQQAFVANGINRVLLATDGDFNVGTVNFNALKDLVAAQRKSGISLTTLGFGSGNYNDHLMEQLADAGNGNYAYIDTLNEAHKVLVEQMSATLQTIAKDVKIQIEFNPDRVAEYRLIGYENRLLQREDFNNDKVDAGDIGAGHSVTALYEITLTGSQGTLIDPLRYGGKAPTARESSAELAFIKLRYKLPDTDTSILISHALHRQDIRENMADTSMNFRFAASVAAFGQLLRGGAYAGNYSYANVLDLARLARGEDRFGYRGEFLKLVNLTRTLAGEPVTTSLRE